MWTAQTLERRILRGLDEAMTGCPVPFLMRSAPSPDVPLVAVVDYLKGYPCFWLTPADVLRRGERGVVASGGPVPPKWQTGGN